MANIRGTRQDTWGVRLTVAGVPMGVWDKKTGGELDSEEFKYSPGDMEDQISLGGRQLPGNVTLQRNYRLGRDHQDFLKILIKNAGKGDATVSVQPKDQDKNDFGKPIVYTGTLKRVSPPDVDSESSTAALIEVEISVDGPPVVA